ncbi:MAG: hypothetical protein K1W41_10730 [Lachnospiraceae bacterium]
MDWNKLTRVNEAPEQGCVLAYLRKRVLFEQYGSLEEVREYIGQDELLELHLFDCQKEYRAIASQSRRYPSGVVETVADFGLDNDAAYIEDIYLEEKYKKFGDKIRICNHLQYDEKGMLEVDNYRLMLKEG